MCPGMHSFFFMIYQIHTLVMLISSVPSHRVFRQCSYSSSQPSQLHCVPSCIGIHYRQCYYSQLEAKTREVLLRIKKLSIECQNLRHSLHGMVSVEYFMQVIRSFTSLCDDTMHLVAYARQGTPTFFACMHTKSILTTSQYNSYRFSARVA